MNRRAFTLIELLVVIAIIAILAAILFPVFAQAKLAAKKSADLSNVKQLSTGITLYTADYDDMYMSAYFHRAFNPALGGTNSGYVHWSGMIMPYVKNLDLFVSPLSTIGGHAPTCWSTADNNSGKGAPGGQAGNVCGVGPNTPPQYARGGASVDEQAPRISYTVNSAVIPRYRNIGDVNRGIGLISQTQLDNVAGTILIAGFTDNLNCLQSQSITPVSRSASHRSTNALSIDAGNTRAYFGSQEDGGTRPAQIFALNYAQVTTGGNRIFELCKTAPRSDYPLAVYTGGGKVDQGDNYGMADGSAKFRKFAQTLSPQQFMWGARVYTDGSAPVIDPISGNPVQQ